MSETGTVRLTVNGRQYERTAPVRLTLADFIREEFIQGQLVIIRRQRLALFVVVLRNSFVSRDSIARPASNPGPGRPCQATPCIG